MGAGEFLRELPLTFIPIFVAIDPFGLIPVVSSILQDHPPEERKTIVFRAVATALLSSIGFVAIGEGLFRVLGISVADFKVAGGVLLLVVAVVDLVRTTERKRWSPDPTVAVVPIGIPLIVGPALLTTLIALLESHGMFPTLLSLLANLALLALVFRISVGITSRTGTTLLLALSKLMSILLAAIGVHMIRAGLGLF
ncbi:MAG: MarC family protein [Deltaproteobacteria bacterium]|nr:MAG: MarC family protein [Deltaproteobacteria bacterium]